MLTLHLKGTDLEIAAEMARLQPEVGFVLDEIRRGMAHNIKREIRGFEAAVLYVLAKQFDYDGAEIVEIGTCYGWSASVMARAAPRAHIQTCTPNHNHAIYARQNTAQYPNVEVLETTSQDWLAGYDGPLLDMIHVDGDHKRVAEDMPWWNWLKVGGLMHHHDYCPDTSPVRPCRWVWNTLNGFSAKLGRGFDVHVEDADGDGVAGWYRREGEEWRQS